VDTWLVLLRGINVGGKRVIPMSDLRDLFADMGFANPVTYIQSGNVVVGSSTTRTAQAASAIERRLTAAFGYDARVVIRDAAQMSRTVRGIPRDWDASDAAMRHNVIFLTEGVRAKGLIDPRSLRPEYESLSTGDGVLYWAAPFSTVNRTAMMRLSSHPSYAEMTVRNLRTTLRLHEIMQEHAGARPRSSVRGASID